ncbi:MAG: hypothetical protein QM820_10395 [Minicystis sp.]
MVYDYEVLLRIDISESADDPTIKDKDFVRKRTAEANIVRFVYRPGEHDEPIPEMGGVIPKQIKHHFDRLGKAQRSRLTLFSHGQPTAIATAGGSEFPGYDGEEMADLLKKWGLRTVSKISLIACHTAVSEKLVLDVLDPAPFHFAKDDAAKEWFLEKEDPDLFKLYRKHVLSSNQNKEKRKPLKPETMRDIERLVFSFGQQFHEALAELPNPIFTEVSARITITKVTPRGHVAVKFPQWGLEYQVPKKELDTHWAHKAPGSKLVFYWRENKEQAVKSVHHEKEHDDNDY